MSDLVERGIAAVRSGDKLTARGLLVRAVQADPSDVDAWIWLSAAVNTDEERLACLTKVLAIHPGHDAAQRGAAALRLKGVGLPSSAEGAGTAAGPDGARSGAVAEPASSLGRASLDHSRTFTQLEPRKRHALRGFSRLAKKQLEDGKKRREVIDGMVARGFPRAAVEELVDEIARPLHRRNLKRYRTQVLRGALILSGAVIATLVLSLVQFDVTAVYFVLFGVIVFGVIGAVAGLVGWLWHRV